MGPMGGARHGLLGAELGAIAAVCRRQIKREILEKEPAWKTKHGREYY